MTKRPQAVITTAEERPRDGWNDPVHGSISWHTLLSDDITPTDSMSAGIAEIHREISHSATEQKPEEY